MNLENIMLSEISWYRRPDIKDMSLLPEMSRTGKPTETGSGLMAAKGFGEVTANGFKAYCGDDTNERSKIDVVMAVQHLRTH